MARFKARALSLVTVFAIAIGIAMLTFWQEQLLTVQAAQSNSTYVVKRGDSLFSIALKLGVDIEALAAANDLVIGNPLLRGDVLVVPGQGTASNEASADEAATEATQEAMQEATAEATQEATEEATEEATQEATEEATQEATEEAEGSTRQAGAEASQEAAAQSTPQPVQESAATPAEKTYKVKAGDSLFSIALKFNVSVDALAEANGLIPGIPLLRGTILVIPGTGVAPQAETMAQPTAEATPEPTQEPTAEATPEPTQEATEEATAEATPEPTEEMMEEAATAEATEEATAEATEEATAEATEEMMEEATAEATEEATAEPTEEAAEEATAEATPEPTEEMTEEGNILETITELGDFTVLLEALEAAGLSETLTTEGPFTLFAPTDTAFDALPAGTVDGLLASSPDDLGQILLYHLVPGEILSTDMADGVTIITAQGGTITISVTADGIMVNDAHITIHDIETTNGIIHVIDAVLLPSDTMAAVPRGAAAPTSLEAASGDAASVIIAPVSITDTIAAARLWAEPDENVALFSPVANNGYHSPIEIIGLSNTFEGHVTINLTAADGTLLAQRMTLGGAEDYGFFHSSVRFHVDQIVEATLSIREIDMAEGTVLSAYDTPVILIPGQRVIDVHSPTVGETVCNPILVSGYSNTFEANVVLTLSEPGGNILAQIPTMGGTMGFYRDFATPLPHQVIKPTPLLLSVAETDASGRTNTIDETVIPITLYPAYNAACY